ARHRLLGRSPALAFGADIEAAGGAVAVDRLDQFDDVIFGGVRLQRAHGEIRDLPAPPFEIGIDGIRRHPPNHTETARAGEFAVHVAGFYITPEQRLIDGVFAHHNGDAAGGAQTVFIDVQTIEQLLGDAPAARL